MPYCCYGDGRRSCGECWVRPQSGPDGHAGDGAWARIFTEPNLKKFDQPTVFGVDFPRVGLSQAYYRTETKTLIVQTYAADQNAAGQKTSFRIKNLVEADSCRVLLNGSPYDSWTVENGEMEISTEIEKQSFEITES